MNPHRRPPYDHVHQNRKNARNARPHPDRDGHHASRRGKARQLRSCRARAQADSRSASVHGAADADAGAYVHSDGHGTSIISRALKITGQLESTENIQIDGQIDGDVRGIHVKVGQSATVKGAVYGEEVEVSGTVEGKIEAKKVVLTNTAHMTGDVIHQDIAIQSGAYVAGHLKPEYGKS